MALSFFHQSNQREPGVQSLQGLCQTAIAKNVANATKGRKSYINGLKKLNLQEHQFIALSLISLWKCFFCGYQFLHAQIYTTALYMSPEGDMRLSFKGDPQLAFLKTASPWPYKFHSLTHECFHCHQSKRGFTPLSSANSLQFFDK